jgi:uncharacterized protein YqjF (DUF2071 family)
MGQTWLDLLFAHWPIAPGVLRPAVSFAVPIDTFDGSAWIGITPFEVVGARPRGLPPLRWSSHFPELNVRTYVTVDGRPGIWFLSLDAARALVVHGARATYRLPYHHARMSVTRDGDGVNYRSESLSRRWPRAAFDATCAPTGPVAEPAAGTLEHFLTERYTLYTVDAAQRLRSADIHHAPRARAVVVDHGVTTLGLGARAAGLGLALAAGTDQGDEAAQRVEVAGDRGGGETPERMEEHAAGREDEQPDVAAPLPPDVGCGQPSGDPLVFPAQERELPVRHQRRKCPRPRRRGAGGDCRPDEHGEVAVAIANRIKRRSELRRPPGDAGDLAVHAVEGRGELHEDPACDD